MFSKWRCLDVLWWLWELICTCLPFVAFCIFVVEVLTVVFHNFTVRWIWKYCDVWSMWIRLVFNGVSKKRKTSLLTVYIHCVSTKVPTFKMSVTLSNLNRFSNLFHCWEAYKICYKTYWHYPLHLRHVATLPQEIKNSNFLQIFSRYGRKCKRIAL